MLKIIFCHVKPRETFENRPEIDCFGTNKLRNLCGIIVKYITTSFTAFYFGSTGENLSNYSEMSKKGKSSCGPCLFSYSKQLHYDLLSRKHDDTIIIRIFFSPAGQISDLGKCFVSIYHWRSQDFSTGAGGGGGGKAKERNNRQSGARSEKRSFRK